MSAAERILNRLDGVRSTGEGRWRARCPAHGSKTLSIAIAERDGKALVHAFCGCTTEAVLGAVNLTLTDLYDRPLADSARAPRLPWTPRDVVDVVLAEASVVSIVAGDMVERREISEADWQRLARSASRLAAIALVVGS